MALAFFDNWYAAIELVKTLYQKGIACAETAHSHSLPNNKLTLDVIMKKKGRHSK